MQKLNTQVTSYGPIIKEPTWRWSMFDGRYIESLGSNGFSKAIAILTILTASVPVILHCAAMQVIKKKIY